MMPTTCADLRRAFDQVAVATPPGRTPSLLLADDAGGADLVVVRLDDVLKWGFASMARKYRIPHGGLADPWDRLLVGIAVQCAEDLSDPVYGASAADFLCEWFPEAARRLGVDV